MSKLRDDEMRWMEGCFSHKGTSQIPQAVNKCLFLSKEAKQLYSSLCQHMYGEKRYSYPSQALLMLELDVAPATLNEYLKELREQKMIRTTFLPAGNLKYILEDIWRPFCLRHSEWIWLLIEEVRKTKDLTYQQIKKDVKKYRNSELYNEVVSSFNGHEHIQLLFEWFSNKWELKGVVNFDEVKSRVTFSLEKNVTLSEDGT
jgi:hypothetical protein